MIYVKVLIVKIAIYNKKNNEFLKGVLNMIPLTLYSLSNNATNLDNNCQINCFKEKSESITFKR